MFRLPMIMHKPTIVNSRAEVSAAEEVFTAKHNYKPRIVIWVICYLVFVTFPLVGLLCDISGFIALYGYDFSDLVGLILGGLSICSALVVINFHRQYYKINKAVRVFKELKSKLENDCQIVPDKTYSIVRRPELYRKGITIGFEANSGKDVFVPDEQLVQHMLVLGSTGTGKTKSFMAMAYQNMLRGGGMIFVDAKRSEANISAFTWMCKTTGRINDLRLLDLGNRKQSHRYNVLAPLNQETPAELRDRIMALMKPLETVTGAEHYRELMKQAMADLMEIFQETGKSFTLRDVGAFIDEPLMALEILLEDMQAKGNQKGIDLVYKLKRKLPSGMVEKKFKDDLSGLRGAITNVLDTEVDSIMCNSSGTEIRLYDVVQRGEILYIALPLLTNSETCNRFMRIFLQHLTYVVGLRSQTTRDDIVAGPPFTIFLDEFGSYALPNFANVITMGRSAGFCVVPSIITPKLLEAKESGLGVAFASNLFNNSRTIISYTIQDPDDAAWVSARWGEKSTTAFTVSVTEGESIGQDRFSTGLKGRVSASANLNSGGREERVAVVPPNILTQYLKKKTKGKGRSIVEADSEEPRIVSNLYVETMPPEGFDYTSEIPQIRSTESNPLALAERIDHRVKGEIKSSRQEPSDKKISGAEPVTVTEQDPDSIASPSSKSRRHGKGKAETPAPSNLQPPPPPPPPSTEQVEEPPKQQGQEDTQDDPSTKEGKTHSPERQIPTGANIVHPVDNGGGDELSNASPSDNEAASASTKMKEKPPEGKPDPAGGRINKKTSQKTKNAEQDAPPWAAYDGDGLGAVNWLFKGGEVP